MGSSRGRQHHHGCGPKPPQPDPGQVLNKLAIHVRRTGHVELQTASGVLTDIFLQPAWEQPIPRTGTRWFYLTGSAGVTLDYRHLRPGLRYRFGSEKRRSAKPGPVQLIPYAGLRVINAHWGHAELRKQRSGRPRRIERQGKALRTHLGAAPDRHPGPACFFPRG